MQLKPAALAIAALLACNPSLADVKPDPETKDPPVRIDTEASVLVLWDRKEPPPDGGDPEPKDPPPKR